MQAFEMVLKKRMNQLTRKRVTTRLNQEMHVWKNGKGKMFMLCGVPE